MRVFCLLAPALLATLVASSPTRGSALETRGGLLVSTSDAARRVDQSIERARRFLLARQRDDGSWDNGGGDADGGRTSLVLLALLSSGESPDSPAVQSALKHLRSITHRTTYGTSLRAAALSLLPERLRKLELQSDLRWLLKAMIEKPPDRGMFTYGQPIAGGGDFSNSQYGVLGVWYAAEAGLEVPTTFWRDVDAAWKRAQLVDGSWGYTSSSTRGYASMTAAAAATLAITEEHLLPSVDLARPRLNQELDRAVAWLGEHFAVDHNAGLDSPAHAGRGGATWLHYLLFGYERVGEITGLTRFGAHRWFERGAEQLARTQRIDGAWNAGLGPDVDAAYALLFLARGAAPVALQKLQFDGRWNNRPLDARRMSRWLRRTFERLVNWQVVSVDAPLDEWREAPILYIASDRALRLTDAHKSRLRDYVEQGGLVLAVNEGPRDDFARSVRALVGELFPPYELRNLPPTHPLLAGNFDGRAFPGRVQAVSNGVRELLVLVSSGDVSARWHGNQAGLRGADNPFSLVGNLWYHVTEGDQVLRKLERSWIERDPAARPQRLLSLARLKFQGNWNPEPAGWTRLSNLLANEGVLDLRVEVAAIDEALLPARFPVAHLAGAGDFALEPDERRELKRYLEQGGLLVCDAAGGSTDAAVSIERMLAQLYPDAPLTIAAPDEPLLRGIDAVGYRRGATDRLRLGTAPRLKVLRIDGQVRALVSSEDLSGGLVGYPRDRIVGYTPASAVRVVRQVLLNASERRR